MLTTIYITKYAFTTGIIARPAEIDKDGYASCPTDRASGEICRSFFSKNDYRLSENEARIYVEVLRERKINSLNKSLKKITNQKIKLKVIELKGLK